MLFASIVLASFLATDPGLSGDSELPLRLDFLQSSLDRSEAPARFWYLGWLSAYGTGLAARTTLAFAGSSDGVRLDSRVGAITIGVGVVTTLVLPPGAAFAAGRLRAMPGRTSAELQSKVLVGESLLREAAHRERLGRSWVPHVGAVAVNLAGGLYLGLHAKRWSSAILAGAGGIAVAELKIFTQPTTADPALKEYELRRAMSWTREAGSLPNPDSSGLVTTLAVTTLPFGVALKGSF